MTRDVLRQSVNHWSPGIKPTWTISEVRNALRLHAEGDFSQSAMLVDSMGEDDLIPGVLEKRTDALLGSDFCLEPVEEPNKQLSARLARRYEDEWFETFPESELEDFDRWLVMLGVAIATLDWSRGSVWKARWRTLHPQFLRWDSFRNVWTYQTTTGTIDVTPGDGRFVLVSLGNRGWMKGAVRSLAVPWISKNLTIRDWNRYNERHGLPIVKAYAPAIAEEGDTLAFWEDVQGLASEMVAQLPTHLDDNGAKFDLELLEAKDQSFESFEKLLDRADRRIMVILLGSNLGTEISSGGSLAASKVHRGVEQSKAAADEKRFSTGIRQQALWPICALNQSGVSLDVVPWPHWDVAPPEDDKANAEAAKIFGEALVKIGEAGYEISNLDEMAERYQLKLKKRPTPEQSQDSSSVSPKATPAAEDPEDETEDPEDPEDPEDAADQSAE